MSNGNSKKGIYVGRFSQADLAAGKDKAAIAAKKAETGLNYINTKYVKSHGEIVGLDVWVCSLADCDTFASLEKTTRNLAYGG